MSNKQYKKQYARMLNRMSASLESGMKLKERLAKLSTIEHLPEGQRAFIISHNLI
jgi:hypothetical protein